ncbi:MAG: hypothetical protein ABSC06_24840 [Rhodopila sp.]
MPDTHIGDLGQPGAARYADGGTTPEFEAALLEAGQLLEHAAGTGLFPDAGPNSADIIIPPLVRAQEATRLGKLTADITIAFWIAYGRLARLSAPVSAASLAASKHVPMLGMKVRSTLVVLLVLASSIFLFMSTATLTETQDLVDQQNTAALKLRADLQVLRNSTHGENAVSPPGTSVIADRVFEQTVEFSRKSNWLLQSADRLHGSFTPWWISVSIEDVTFNETNKKGMDHLNVPPEVSTATEIENEAVYQVKAYQNIRDYALGLCKIDSLIYTGLSTYFLPTIYALLGAFLYGFRMYSRLIRRKEFLPSAAHSARYYIASIAGLVVGLFGSLLPKGMALPPLAVAFLVGYAVEAFFSRLDDLIRKLKSSNSTAMPPPTKPLPAAPAAE